jgi:hypothetical protein
MRTSIIFLATLLISPLLVSGALVVTADSPKTTAAKTVVRLAIKNTFTEKVESARATVFLLGDKGKLLGQATRWVIGGNKEKTGLAPDATQTFNFVITTHKSLVATNITAKVNFSRIVLEGGKLADAKDVQIQTVQK